MRVSRQFSNVVACSPVLRGGLSARAGFENATVDLFGIDPAAHLRTTNLAQQADRGQLRRFPQQSEFGHRRFAAREALGVERGRLLQLLSPGGEYWRFHVAAIARSGVGSVDSGRIYCAP